MLFERKICYGHKLLPSDSAGNNAIEISATTACLETQLAAECTHQKEQMANFLLRARFIVQIFTSIAEMGQLDDPTCRRMSRCPIVQFAMLIYPTDTGEITFLFLSVYSSKAEIKLIEA